MFSRICAAVSENEEGKARLGRTVAPALIFDSQVGRWIEAFGRKSVVKIGDKPVKFFSRDALSERIRTHLVPRPVRMTDS